MPTKMCMCPLLQCSFRGIMSTSWSPYGLCVKGTYCTGLLVRHFVVRRHISFFRRGEILSLKKWQSVCGGKEDRGGGGGDGFLELSPLFKPLKNLPRKWEKAHHSIIISSRDGSHRDKFGESLESLSAGETQSWVSF
jgi:hypothetical protein